MSFRLTEAALQALQARISKAGVDEPVIGLIRVASQFNSDAELNRMLASLDTDDAELRKKFLALNPDPDELEYRWAPSVYERNGLPDEYIYETSGIRFRMHTQLQKHLENTVLDVANNEFIFRGVEPF